MYFIAIEISIDLIDSSSLREHFILYRLETSIKFTIILQNRIGLNVSKLLVPQLLIETVKGHATKKYLWCNSMS